MYKYACFRKRVCPLALVCTNARCCLAAFKVQKVKKRYYWIFGKWVKTLFLNQRCRGTNRHNPSVGQYSFTTMLIPTWGGFYCTFPSGHTLTEEWKQQRGKLNVKNGEKLTASSDTCRASYEVVFVFCWMRRK